MNQVMPSWAEQLIVFDTETTGVSTTHSRVVTACVAVIDKSGLATERYDWLLNPGIEIPEAAAMVHGVTTEMAVASGTLASAGIAQIIAKLDELVKLGLPLVIYNAPYDLTLLKNEAIRHGIEFSNSLRPVLDPLVIDKHLDKYRRGKRTLIAVAEHYGVVLDTAHDAGADAIAAGQVMQRLATKYKTHLPEDVQELHDGQVRWATEQAASFQEYMRRAKDPAFVADGSWPIRLG